MASLVSTSQDSLRTLCSCSRSIPVFGLRLNLLDAPKAFVLLISQQLLSAPVVIAGPMREAFDVVSQEAGGRRQQLVDGRAGSEDLKVVQDGAYGASKSPNYNNRLLVPEVFLDGGNDRFDSVPTNNR
jgi:hypothetical protein